VLEANASERDGCKRATTFSDCTI